jgi:dihydroceramide fatty acyl 2-hydroxylase
MRKLRLSAMAPGYPQSLLLPSVALLWMIWLWLRAPAIDWLGGLILLASGLLTWTLFEYLLHRLMLHRVEPFQGWHRQHHLHPDVPMRTPVTYSLMLLLPLAGLPLLLHTHVGAAAAFSLGQLVGYLLQEIVHHGLHKAARPVGAWLSSRWREHDFHHHRDEHLAYGTLTRFCDDVFRTSTDRRPGTRGALP